MSKNTKKVTLHANNQQDTARVARVIADIVAGTSGCIELVGDVGAGKTTFTRMLAAQLGSKELVTSPTFTLENVYTAPKNIIHHFDLYRLQDVGLLPEEVNEALQESDSIVIIEWADILTQNSTLPEDRIIVRFNRDASHEDARVINVSAPEMSSIIPALEKEFTL